MAAPRTSALGWRWIAAGMGLVAVLLGSCRDDGGSSGSEGPPVERVGDAIARGDAESTLVAASPQRTDGAEVVVDKVVLTDGPGYVVIYADGGGAPGRQLGVSDQLPEGTSEDVTIDLDEPLEETGIVHAMVHLEDNENGVFDYPAADQPASLEDGIVEVSFKVTVDP